jgi:molybdenum cofactor synthesis domain-containing protein
MTLCFGILTASDRSFAGTRPDLSGPALVEAVIARGWSVIKREVVPDDRSALERILIQWADSGEVDVILVTGGTGFAPRDVTPEATRAVVERLTPGIDEAMRAASLRVTPHGMLSRGVSGLRKRTLIVNLPGSPKGAVENFNVIAPVLGHASELLNDSPNAEQGHERT